MNKSRSKTNSGHSESSVFEQHTWYSNWDCRLAQRQLGCWLVTSHKYNMFWRTHVRHTITHVWQLVITFLTNASELEQWFKRGNQSPTVHRDERSKAVLQRLKVAWRGQPQTVAPRAAKDYLTPHHHHGHHRDRTINDKGSGRVRVKYTESGMSFMTHNSGQDAYRQYVIDCIRPVLDKNTCLFAM